MMLNSGDSADSFKPLTFAVSDFCIRSLDESGDRALSTLHKSKSFAIYPEIAPHLALMAFLHRVINGGVTLEREYAIGRDRMDLYLLYGEVTFGIELKVWLTRKADPLSITVIRM